MQCSTVVIETSQASSLVIARPASRAYRSRDQHLANICGDGCRRRCCFEAEISSSRQRRALGPWLRRPRADGQAQDRRPGVCIADQNKFRETSLSPVSKPEPRLVSRQHLGQPCIYVSSDHYDLSSPEFVYIIVKDLLRLF